MHESRAASTGYTPDSHPQPSVCFTVFVASIRHDGGVKGYLKARLNSTLCAIIKRRLFTYLCAINFESCSCQSLLIKTYRHVYQLQRQLLQCHFASLPQMTFPKLLSNPRSLRANHGKALQYPGPSFSVVVLCPSVLQSYPSVTPKSLLPL